MPDTAAPWTLVDLDGRVIARYPTLTAATNARATAPAGACVVNTEPKEPQ